MRIFLVILLTLVAVGSIFLAAQGILKVASALSDGRPAFYDSKIHQDDNESIESKIARVGLGSISDPHMIIPHDGKSIGIDLVDMTITLYEDGQKVEDFTIQAKGRPGSAWETPPGVYRALHKRENHFSSISQVWMPYSVQFFGNFFIHGWPYYPNGRQVASTFSGGCIRLATADAKRVFEFVELGTPIFIWNDKEVEDDKRIGETSAYYYYRDERGGPKVSAQAYVVADLDTGEVILQKNKDRVMPIASITKLMTALTSLEALNQHQMTTVSKRAVDTYGFAGRLSVGDRLYVRDLLYPLLLESSNDAAEVLAEHSGRANFMKRMNEKTAAIGLKNTSFDDPSGLSAKNVSTAADLFKLSQYLFNYKKHVFEITQKRTHTVGKHTWYSNSKFVREKNFLGSKNGYTHAARNTVVSLFSVPLAEFSDRNIAVVLLGAGNTEHDTRNILRYLEKNVYYGGERDANLNLISRKFVKNPGDEFRSAIIYEKEDDVTTMILVGDIMLNRGVKQTVLRRAEGDYRFMFENAGFLREADILFGNLEGPISDVGTDLGNLYSFRMSPAVMPALRDVGFNVLSVANNHMGDWGVEAFTDTLTRLANNRIISPGGGLSKAEAEKPQVITKHGVKFGFLAFTDVGPAWLAAGKNKPGILLANDPKLPEIITKAAKEVDVLVVSYHFGEEYQQEPNQRQINLGRLAINSGAKVVAGHHPHVVQKVERYGGGVIAYSLGNFIFDQGFSEETMRGLALEIKFKGKEIIEINERKTVQNQLFQPSLELPNGQSSVDLKNNLAEVR
jgi:D-alanyl-D-alanine carboxypeptidase